jgi:hypothetical protein
METWPSSEFTEEELVWQVTIPWLHDEPVSGFTEGEMVPTWQTAFSCEWCTYWMGYRQECVLITFTLWETRENAVVVLGIKAFL